MRLSVLNVAYPLAPVGPDAIGGAEQVLARLDAALVRAGHESIVLACEGSVTQGELIAGFLVQDGSMKRRENRRVRNIEKPFSAFWSRDASI